MSDGAFMHARQLQKFFKELSDQFSIYTHQRIDELSPMHVHSVTFLYFTNWESCVNCCLSTINMQVWTHYIMLAHQSWRQTLIQWSSGQTQRLLGWWTLLCCAS